MTSLDGHVPRGPSEPRASRERGAARGAWLALAAGLIGCVLALIWLLGDDELAAPPVGFVIGQGASGELAPGDPRRMVVPAADGEIAPLSVGEKPSGQQPPEPAAFGQPGKDDDVAAKQRSALATMLAQSANLDEVRDLIPWQAGRANSPFLGRRDEQSLDGRVLDILTQVRTAARTDDLQELAAYATPDSLWRLADLMIESTDELELLPRLVASDRSSQVQDGPPMRLVVWYERLAGVTTETRRQELPADHPTVLAVRHQRSRFLQRRRQAISTLFGLPVYDY